MNPHLGGSLVVTLATDHTVILGSSSCDPGTARPSPWSPIHDRIDTSRTFSHLLARSGPTPRPAPTGTMVMTSQKTSRDPHPDPPPTPPELAPHPPLGPTDHPSPEPRRPGHARDRAKPSRPSRRTVSEASKTLTVVARLRIAPFSLAIDWNRRSGRIMLGRPRTPDHVAALGLAPITGGAQVLDGLSLPVEDRVAG